MRSSNYDPSGDPGGATPAGNSGPSAGDLERWVEVAAAGARRTSRDELRDRYRGVLLGVAAGNALGLPVEGRPRAWIRRQYPEGLADVDGREPSRPWDDDLAQTVLLAEALVERADLDLDDLAARLVRWRKENGRGIGTLTAAVIAELAAGTPARLAAQRVWERGGRSSAGNGAVMRCAPVALRWRRSGGQLVEQTWRSAVVTHADPRCPWSAVVLNAVLALSLSEQRADMERLAASVDAVSAPAEVGAAVRAVPGCSLDHLALDHAAMGYTLKAMQVGLWCLEQGADFEKALVAVVNAGGDTDTNGAVAAGLMGSRGGLGGMPPRWLQNIRAPDRILALDDALFDPAEQPDPPVPPADTPSGDR